MFLEILHNDGTPAATFTILTAHMDPHTGAPLPWERASISALENLACNIPAHGAPRSIDMSRPPDPHVNRARADTLNVPTTGRYAVWPQQCDAFGTMQPQWFIGRISDSMANVRARQMGVRSAPTGERQIGGAALEYRITMRNYPVAGDLIEVRSSVVEAVGKTRRMVHWLVDPQSGAAWASAEVVAVLLDMQTRKSIEMTDVERDEIMAIAIPAMWSR